MIGSATLWRTSWPVLSVAKDRMRSNAMDDSYRLELRQLNDANFARFEAKLDQRIAELRAELRAELAGLRAEMRESMANLRAELSGQFVVQTRWMFGMWATLFLAIIATWFSRR